MSVTLQSVAYIGVGSNLLDPVQQVKQALAALDQMPETRCIQSSSLYCSKPMGPIEQPDYINAVAELETTLPASTLLQQLQVLEVSQGRKRGPERWAPRTLDLDIILYNEEVINNPDLTVPHPGMHERAFVLYPLYEIAPDLQIPGWGGLKQLLDTVAQSIKNGEIPERLYVEK